jgi:hypothetical protein
MRPLKLLSVATDVGERRLHCRQFKFLVVFLCKWPQGQTACLSVYLTLVTSRLTYPQSGPNARSKEVCVGPQDGLVWLTMTMVTMAVVQCQ